MKDRFIDDIVHRRHRFSLGRDLKGGTYYLSTPISGFNHAAEYEAYFRISAEEYRHYSINPDDADDFLEDCRMHRNLDRLIYP